MPGAVGTMEVLVTSITCGPKLRQADLCIASIICSRFLASSLAPHTDQLTTISHYQTTGPRCKRDFEGSFEIWVIRQHQMLFRKCVQHYLSALDLVQCKIIDFLNVEEFLVGFYELPAYRSNTSTLQCTGILATAALQVSRQSSSLKNALCQVFILQTPFNQCHMTQRQFKYSIIFPINPKMHSIFRRQRAKEESERMKHRAGERQDDFTVRFYTFRLKNYVHLILYLCHPPLKYWLLSETGN